MPVAGVIGQEPLSPESLAAWAKASVESSGSA